MDTKKISSILGTAIIAIIVILIAVSFLSQKPSQSQPPSSSNNPTTSAATSTASGQPCYLIPNGEITIYSRPSFDATVFGVVTKGEKIYLGGKTQDGWYGFDPASAQAPNVGPFRLRYINQNNPFSLEGNCASLPIVPNLPAKICFVMIHSDAPVYATPNASSTILLTMHRNDYAKAIGRNNSSYNSFIKVDTSVGNLNSNIIGWVSLMNIDFNGSECENLPITTK